MKFWKRLVSFFEPASDSVQCRYDAISHADVVKRIEDASKRIQQSADVLGGMTKGMRGDRVKKRSRGQKKNGRNTSGVR